MAWWWKRKARTAWGEHLIMRPGPRPEPPATQVIFGDLTADDLRRQAQRCDDRAADIEAFDPLTQSVLLEAAAMLRTCAAARRPRGGIQGLG